MSAEQHEAVGPMANVCQDESLPEAQATPQPPLGNVLHHQLQDLQDIAAQVHSVGTRQVMYGRALVNQQRLDAAMQALTAKILSLGRKRRTSRGDVTLIAKLTHSLAQLSGKTTDSQRLLVEMEKPPSPPLTHPEFTLNKCFRPGEKVRPPEPNQSAHFDSTT